MKKAATAVDSLLGLMLFALHSAFQHNHFKLTIENQQYVYR